MSGTVGLPSPVGSRLTALAYVGIPLAAAAVGLAIGSGHQEVIVLSIAPFLVFIGAALAGRARWLVVPTAVAIGMIGDPLTERLPLGGAGIWLSDFLVGGAIAGYVCEWLLTPAHRRPRVPRSAVIGLPLIFFFVALMIGAFRGNERYDATLIGMPLRLVAYSAVVLALTGVTAKQALRGITIVVYGGTLWLAGVAAYHVGTGTSATEYAALSTGGMRYIGTTAAAYAASAFLLAVYNLASGVPRPMLHLAIATLAGLEVIVAYTRTIWLALAILLLVSILLAAPVRRGLVQSIPIVLPVLLLAVLVTIKLQPDLVTTLVDRMSTPAGQDSSVDWRAHAYQAVLSGTSTEPLLGVGFGRSTSFSINGMPNYVAGDPHNGYIYVYAGSGMLGAAALALLMLAYLFDVARRWTWARGEDRTLLAWCFVTWLIFMFHAASEPVFTSPTRIILIWIATLLPAVVVRPPRDELEPAARAAAHRGLAKRRPTLEPAGVGLGR